MKKSSFFSAKRITGLAVLLALVIVLQSFGSYFVLPTGTPLSFVLVPIVLAGLLYGPVEGGLVGFAFGVVVIIQGLMGVDPFTQAMMIPQPIATIFLCLIKGTAAGVVSGCLYRIFRNKKRYVGVFTAAAAAPIVNTGLFVLGALCFLQEAIRTTDATITGYGGESMIYYLVFVVAGINFLVEFAINLLLAPTLYRAANIIEGRFDNSKNYIIDDEENV